MTEGAGTLNVEVDARDIMSSLQLNVTVRGKRRALWRMKIAVAIVALAGRVLGGKVELSAEVQ